MSAPKWLKNAGSATAIALSSVPILLSVPGVIDAHNALNREVERVHMVSGALGQTASADTAEAPAAAVRAN